MELNNKEKEFIEEIIKLEKKYDLSLSHEDGQGSFMIEEKFDDFFAKWLRNAYKG